MIDARQTPAIDGAKLGRVSNSNVPTAPARRVRFYGQLTCHVLRLPSPRMQKDIIAAHATMDIHLGSVAQT